jgi:hypothetical protein
MMPEITNRHSTPTCRIVVARTDSPASKPFYTRRRILETISGGLESLVRQGLLFGKTNFGCPPTLYGKSREIGAMLQNSSKLSNSGFKPRGCSSIRTRESR